MSSSKDRKNQVEQFCSITGATKEVAKQILTACDYNVEMAINMHVESIEVDEPNNDNNANNGSIMPAPDDPPLVAPLMDLDDDVRAPIAPVQEVLVEGSFSSGLRSRRRVTRSVFDGFRDFQAETREQEQDLLNNSRSSRASRKQKTLEDLFRPPLDLMHRGSFESAKKVGQCSNKWLLVNIQNVQEFPCQVLNRDVWSNQAVKTVIREHFVFWQVYHDSEEGQRYMQFYKVLDWPYVGILDPRTGEKVVVWNKIDSLTFCDLVSEFLKSNPSLDGSFSSIPPPSKRLRSDSILDASEDSQLEAAIKASLTESTGAGAKKTSAAGAAASRLQDRGNEAGVASTSTCSSRSPTSAKQCASSESFCRSSVITSTAAAATCTAPLPPIEDVDDDEDDEVETFDTDSEDSRPAINKMNATVPTDSAGGNTSTSSSKVSETQTVLDWRLYLGTNEDPKSNVNVRYPDGSKDQFIVPSSSKLQALLLYVQSKGFSKDNYELVTNFPRRLISELDSDTSMKDAGLFPQETVFVQAR